MSEYLDGQYTRSSPALSEDSAARLEARLWNRLFDPYVQFLSLLSAQTAGQNGLSRITQAEFSTYTWCAFVGQVN
jgi:hypothetical protein